MSMLKVAKGEADKGHSKEASNMVWTTTEKEKSLYTPFKLVNENRIWTPGKNCSMHGTRTSYVS